MKQEFFDISLLNRNSFKIDQRAARVVEFDSQQDLFDIFSGEAPTEWYVLSGGNNTLFTKDFEGVIITPKSSEIEIISSDRVSARVRVAAGVEWDDFALWAVQNNLWGVENLSLIPGKVGAAPIQNIGAYGVEVKDVIEQVEMFVPESLNTLSLQGDHCGFGYRDSVFKRSLKGRVIITHVTFRLSKIATPKLAYGDVVAQVAALGEVTLSNIRQAICTIRTAKLPDTEVVGNAGSFFKNPVVEAAKGDQLKALWPDMPLYPIATDPDKVKLAAGWLIDKAGFKGYQEGRVGVHANQALVLVNLGGAKGCEVLALAEKIIERVKEMFGVELSPEVNIL